MKIISGGISSTYVKILKLAICFIVLGAVLTLLISNKPSNEHNNQSSSSLTIHVVESRNSQTAEESPLVYHDLFSLPNTSASSVDSYAPSLNITPDKIPDTTSDRWNPGQCPAIQMGYISFRLTEFCGGIEPLVLQSNSWKELLTVYRMIPEFTTRLVYDLERDYVWVIVQKIASTNMKRVILADKMRSHKLKKGLNLETPNIAIEKCCLLTTKVAQQHNSLRHSFTFTFTRNPWTRLHSAYGDKIVRYSSFHQYEFTKGILRIVRGWTVQQVRNTNKVKVQAGTITFTEFLTWVAMTDTDKLNVHFTPWYVLTQPCNIKYDYIGYAEDMDASFKFIKDTLFSDSDISIPPAYVSKAKLDEVIAAYMEVPLNVLDLIYIKFENDFVIGGYSRDIKCIS